MKGATANETPCLSVLQPFASAIMFGPKDVENRSRAIFNVPPGGVWVGIHASKGPKPGGGISTQEFIDNDREDYADEWPGVWDVTDWHLGCVLGVVHVVRRVDINPNMPDEQQLEAAQEQLGAWATGPICYVLGEKRPLAKPMPARGALGLWRPQPDVAAALAALVSR